MDSSNNFVETKIFGTCIIHSIMDFSKDALTALSNRIVIIHQNAKCYVYCGRLDKMYIHIQDTEYLTPMINVGGANPMSDPSYIKLNKSGVQVTHQERDYRTDYETH